MNCEQIHAQFDERLDGRLDAGAVAAFDSHLGACAACRRQWESYAGLWDAIGRQPSIAPSFGFAERTLRRLAATPVPARPWFWQPAWRWAWLGVALLVAGTGAWQTREQRLAAHHAMVYTRAQQADYLEDYDVIASLDQLTRENEL